MGRGTGVGRGLSTRFGPVDGEVLKAARRIANVLHGRERIAAVALAAYSALVFTLIRAAGDIGDGELGVGVALAALLVVALRSNHRLVVGGAAAVVGGFGPWKMWGLFALPLLVFTTYLLVKARGSQERELRRARNSGAGVRSVTASGRRDSDQDNVDLDVEVDEPRPPSRRQQKPHPRSKKKQKRRR